MTKEKKVRFPALAYRDFRLFFIAQFLSSASTQTQIVAVNWHLYVLTNSAFALGLIGLMRFIPIIFFSLIGGNAADVYDRKKIIYIVQIIAAVLSSLLFLFTATGRASPLLLYVVTALAAVTTSFDIPSRQAIVPNLVSRKHLPNAMSLNVTVFNISTIIGPSIAGILIASLGLTSAYVVNTLSFAAAIFLFAALGTKTTRGEETSISAESIKDGFRFVRSKTIIWSTMILDFFSTFFSSATALLPIFAKDILAVGPQGLGFLYAAPAVGSVIAGFTLSHMGTISKQGRWLISGVILYGLSTIVFGFSTWFLVSFVALVLVGIGDGISTVIRNTIRQAVTPDRLRGRMTAVNMLFFMGGPQIGEFEAGALAALAGAPFSVMTGGVGTVIAAVILAVTIPVLRKFDTHEDIFH